MTQHFHRYSMRFESLPNLVICLADCLQKKKKKKRGISSKLHQNAIVALNSVAVWFISECKAVYFRRNHITILQCQCQYITE